MHRWYAIQAIAGRESSVKHDIETRMANFGQSHNLRRIVVPTESRIEEKHGQKREVQHRILPGYILLNCNLTDDAWSVIKNTKGVLNFLGASEPMPLSEEEVRRMIGTPGGEKPALNMVEFAVGDAIVVCQGHALGGFEGPVIEVNLDQRKLKAEIMIFERAVSTEFAFDQVEKQRN